MEKPDYRGLVQPVTGLSEAAQRELLAPFEPSEVYVCRTAEDFDNYLKQMRPPRVALVAYAGVLGEQRGNKEARVENMVAMKVAIHNRGATSLRSSPLRKTRRAGTADKIGLP